MTTTDWIDPLVIAARKLANLGHLTADFTFRWIALEDAILTLDRAAQIDLYNYASGMTSAADAPAAMILLGMIPDDIADAAEA